MMATRSFGRGRLRKQVPTTLGRAPSINRNEPVDLSHVRTPIDTSIFGLKQVLTLFETATDEVRRYIAYECNIIYECRTCRSLFRSLANFILHKRSYCHEIYEPIPKSRKTDVEENCYEIHSDSANEVEEVEQETKPARTLTDVLKKLTEKQENFKISEEIARGELSPEEPKESVEEPEPEPNKQHSNKVCLEKIENSNSGVFQTIPNELLGGDLMKSEVMEIHSILSSNEAILQPDGKVFSFQTGQNKSKSNTVKRRLTCTLCSLHFSTKKTLTYHIKYKHNETRIVYPCPECKDTFANAWCVFRHLYKVHRKTTGQIRKLRDLVHTSAIIQKQGNNIMKDKSSFDDVNNVDRENQWLNNLEDDGDLQMCGGCGKRFERRAALHSHSQTCMKRMAVCNSIKKNHEEKPTKQKSQNETLLKGSKRRKPNVLRKMVKATDKTKVSVESARNQEKIDQELMTDIDLEKRHIEEVIFGNRLSILSKEKLDAPTEKADDSRNDPIIILHSDDEDTIGFPSENENEKSSDTELVVEENEKITLNEVNDKEIESPVKCITPDVNITDNDKLSDLDDPIETNDQPEESNFDNNDINEEYLLEDDINTNSDADIFSNLDIDLIINGISQKPDIIVDLTDDCIPEINSETTNISPPVSTTSRSDTSTPPLIIDEQLTPRSAKKRKRLSDEISLKTKSEEYVNWDLHQCTSCKISFKTNECLMEHMALHFDWFRFQCSECTFVSYDDKICLAHLKTEHKVDPLLQELSVIPLSNWKSLKLSSEFKRLEPTTTQKESTYGDIDTLNREDPMVRKMIMEVIFGPNAAATAVNDAKTNSTRSRNCVKALDKDFVYDMNFVDTQIRHQSAMESKVKPIRIVKNNECDFKVISLSPSHQKKKKCY